MIYSVFYLLSIIGACFFLSLSFDHENPIRALTLSLIISFSVYAAFCGLLSFFSIGPSLVFATTSNLIVAVISYRKLSSPTLRLVIRCNPISKNIDKFDKLKYIFAALAIIAVALFCGFKQFGPSFDAAFLTSDPSIHYYNALKILNGTPVSGQYLAASIIGTWFQALAPLVDQVDLFHVYVVSEIVLLALSGLSMLEIISLIAPQLNPIIAGGVSVFYLLGYPLNNMEFGFCYLGIGVTVIISISQLCIRFVEFQTIFNDRFSTICLSVCLFGLITSYSLFVPVVYLSVFIWSARDYYSYSKDWKITLFRELELFSFPVLLGLLLVYQSIFGSAANSPTVVSAIATEGYIYRDLYSNFILIGPFSLYGLFVLRKQRYWAVTLTAALFIVFSMTLFLLGITGHVSSYYFYKLHFVIWALFYIGLAAAINDLIKGHLSLVMSWSIIFILLFVICLTGLDSKLTAARPLFNQVPVSSSYFKIYEFNNSNFGSKPIMDDEKATMLENVTKTIGGSSLKLLLDDADAYWCDDMLTLNQSGYWWTLTKESCIAEYSSSDYVLAKTGKGVLTTSDGVDRESVLSELTEHADVVTDLGNDYILLKMH